MKIAKRLCSMLLSLCFLLSLMPGRAFASSNNLPFTDVATTDWYHDSVRYVYDKGMMNGTSTSTFSPNSTTTRGMIVTILHRMEGTPASVGMTFTDVSVGQWYSNAVAWASANGIVNGYGNGKFGPNDAITREQMATILYRYSQYKNYANVNTSGSLTGFSDSVQVSSYATSSMSWAVGIGLISGVGNNTLAPKGNATRAQVATILMRFCESLDKLPVTPPTDGDQATGEELVKAAETDSNILHSIEEPFRDKSGHVDMSDWPELLEKLDAWGRQAKAEGKLLDYASSKDEYSVTIQDPTGLVMCYVPPIQELEEYAGSVQTYEPFYGVDENFEKAKKKYGTIDQAAEKIKALGYDFSTNADGKDVTFDTLKQWKPDGVILWQGHGCLHTAGISAILTTMKLEDHREEYASYNIKGNGKDALVVIDDDMNIGVTPKFFDCFYQDSTSLRGSMIWLGCCYSAYQEGFASVFQKKGASLTIGSPDQVKIDYVVHLADKFLDTLTSKDGAKYSAKEALAQAKKWVKCPEGSADMIAQGDDFWLSATTEPTTVSLPGVILDDVSKEAVKGAVVSIDGVNQATTDAFGKFTAKVPKVKDALPVRVVCNGYEDYEAIVSLNKVQKGWTITLTPAGKGNVTLSIRLDPDQGKITNGTVAVYELTDVKRNEDGSIQGIDDSGTFISSKKLIKNVSFYRDTFEISGLEWKNAYGLEIAPEGYNIEMLVCDCLSLDNPDNPETMVVKVTAKIPQIYPFTLTVTDLQTGAPVSNAAVTLSGRSNDTETYQKLTSGSTDAKGLFWANVEGEYTDLRADVVKDGYIAGAIETTEATASLTLSEDPGQIEKPTSPSEEVPEGYTPIYTAEDLEAINGKEQYILMNDIQIFTYRSYFEVWDGVMDGNGHSIIFLSQNDIVERNGPNWITKNRGILRNITFKNVCRDVSNQYHAAALVGENYGTIEHCEIASGRIFTIDGHSAGFVDYNDTSGIIRNCINRAEISANVAYGSYGTDYTSAIACGIACGNWGIIEGCANYGSIHAKATSSPNFSIKPKTIVAGIVGINGGTVKDCINQGKLSWVNSAGNSYAEEYEICPEN